MGHVEGLEEKCLKSLVPADVEKVNLMKEWWEKKDKSCQKVGDGKMAKQTS